MAQANHQRLDAQFAFDDEAGVQMALRLLTKVIEARLADLESQRSGIDGVVDSLTAIALTRIDEVLTPSFLLIQQLISLGFPADRITDSGAVGRSVLRAKDRSEFLSVSGAASQADVAAALNTANQGIAEVSNSLAVTLAKVNAITAGADPLLDTFVELVARLQGDEAGLASVLEMVNNRLRFDTAQALTQTQRTRAMTSLGLSGVGQQVVQATDQAAARAAINAQANLGFFPVQNDGAGNVVKLRWESGRLRARVDASDLGDVWNGATCQLDTGGYQRLASGLIIQFGYSFGNDRYVAFPVTFPGALVSLTTAADVTVADDEAISLTTDGRTTSGFALRSRMSKSGLSYRVNTGATWIALGF